eukprot:g4603.t1
MGEAMRLVAESNSEAKGAAGGKQEAKAGLLKRLLGWGKGTEKGVELGESEDAFPDRIVRSAKTEQFLESDTGSCDVRRLQAGNTKEKFAVRGYRVGLPGEEVWAFRPQAGRNEVLNPGQWLRAKLMEPSGACGSKQDACLKVRWADGWNDDRETTPRWLVRDYRNWSGRGGDAEEKEVTTADGASATEAPAGGEGGKKKGAVETGAGDAPDAADTGGNDLIQYTVFGGTTKEIPREEFAASYKPPKKGKPGEGGGGKGKEEKPAAEVNTESNKRPFGEDELIALKFFADSWKAPHGHLTAAGKLRWDVEVMHRTRKELNLLDKESSDEGAKIDPVSGFTMDDLKLYTSKEFRKNAANFYRRAYCMKTNKAMAKLIKKQEASTWMTARKGAYESAFDHFVTTGFRLKGEKPDGKPQCPTEVNPSEFTVAPGQPPMVIHRPDQFPNEEWVKQLWKVTEPFQLEMAHVNAEAIEKRSCDADAVELAGQLDTVPRNHAPPEFYGVELRNENMFRADNLCKFRSGVDGFGHCVETEEGERKVIRQTFLREWAKSEEAGALPSKKSTGVLGSLGRLVGLGKTTKSKTAPKEKKTTEIWFEPRSQEWFICKAEDRRCSREAVTKKGIVRQKVDAAGLEKEGGDKEKNKAAEQGTDSTPPVSATESTDPTRRTLEQETSPSNICFALDSAPSEEVCIPSMQLRVIRTHDLSINEGTVVEIKLMPGEPREQGMVTKLWPKKAADEADDEVGDVGSSSSKNAASATGAAAAGASTSDPRAMMAVEMRSTEEAPKTTSDGKYDCADQGCAKVIFLDEELNESPDRVFAMKDLRKAMRIEEGNMLGAGAVLPVVALASLQEVQRRRKPRRQCLGSTATSRERCGTAELSGWSATTAREFI